MDSRNVQENNFNLDLFLYLLEWTSSLQSFSVDNNKTKGATQGSQVKNWVNIASGMQKEIGPLVQTWEYCRNTFVKH